MELLFNISRRSWQENNMIFSLFTVSAWGKNHVHGFFLAKPLIIISWTISLSIWSYSTSIWIINRQPLAKAECTTTIFSGVQPVWDLFTRGLSSTLSRQAQSRPSHWNTFLCYKSASPYAYFNILNVSVAVKPFRTKHDQNSLLKVRFHENHQKQNMCEMQ